jgi:hypothetical protein
MDLRSEVAALYDNQPDSNGFLPFVGDAYQHATAGVLRVLVVGINAYLSDGHEKEPREMRGWWPAFWAEAGHASSSRFFTRAFEEADLFARRVTAESELFEGLGYSGDPKTKVEFYATNAVKVWLGEAFKTSDAVTPELAEKYRDLWHSELDLLARHDVLPHLIVGLGDQVWPHLWEAFYGKRFTPKEFKVTEYTGCVDDAPAHHYALRTGAERNGKTQPILVVRFHHPSAFPKEPKRAEWLLARPEFRELARMPALV